MFHNKRKVLGFTWLHHQSLIRNWIKLKLIFGQYLDWLSDNVYYWIQYMRILNVSEINYHTIHTRFYSDNLSQILVTPLLFWKLIFPLYVRDKLLTNKFLSRIGFLFRVFIPKWTYVSITFLHLSFMNLRFVKWIHISYLFDIFFDEFDHL